MPESEWETEKAPEDGAIHYALAADRHGRYPIPFRVVYSDGRWWNAHTGQKLETVIVGWRPVGDA
jgi:hypothetical protein